MATPVAKHARTSPSLIIEVRFRKAEANGNDFLIVDEASVPLALRPEFVRRACDRHYGVGADGVEFTGTGAAGRRTLTLYNADGSPAEISGNGTRCAVAVAASHEGFREGTLFTGAGPRQARVLGHDGAVWDIELEMGAPRWAPEEIPMRARGLDRVVEHPLWIGHRCLKITALSLGNPHCCVIVPQFLDDWVVWGERICAHRSFPQRTNVEFIQRTISRRHILVRLYERGVGRTLSSGTGSCAAAVAAICQGIADSPVDVVSEGGTQTVSWTPPDGKLLLRGPARVVAHGVMAFSPTGPASPPAPVKTRPPRRH